MPRYAADEGLPMTLSANHAWFALACLLSCLQAKADTWARLPAGQLYTPDSSIERPQDRGVRAHSNISLFFPDAPPAPTANTPGGFFETPASLACIYKQVKVVVGCNPSVVTVVSTRGSNAIAIVDPYDDPNARSDLISYSKEFGLPTPTVTSFQIVYAAAGTSTQTTTRPPQDPTGGWESEEALDIEMAHAMAPHAKLYLVEANSSGSGDLFPAVILASNLVAAAGGGEVSMSWGFGPVRRRRWSRPEGLLSVVIRVPGISKSRAPGPTPEAAQPRTSRARRIRTRS
jgi:hypothetical protein